MKIFMIVLILVILSPWVTNSTGGVPKYREARHMTISNRGIALIKEFEGLYLDAYICPAGKNTIGYGTVMYRDTGEVVRLGDTITEEEADKLLKLDIKDKYEKYIREYVKVDITQNQYDALVSFVYNVGGGAFSESTLLKKLNKGDYEGASEEFERWVYGGGVRLKGLVRRRKAEKELFLE